MRANVILSLVLAVVAFGVSDPPPAAAQIPDTFMNLQVLPKDIPRRELIATMREMAGGLGVRCTHCHVGPDNLQGMDFGSDTKDEKKAARAMLRMTRAMNTDYLAHLPGAEGERREVTCLTCHRRSAKPPRPLFEILEEAALKDGAAAAIQRYRDLRATDLDKGWYDFRPDSISIAATRLLDSGKQAEALALARQALELFPDSASYQAFLGQVCLQARDLPCAETALKKALELEPANPVALRVMEALKKQQAPPPR